MTISLEEFDREYEKEKAERKALEKEIEQGFLESAAAYAKARAVMHPALEAAKYAQMKKEHAAQLAEMDRILAEEEKKMKTQETEWAKEDTSEEGGHR
jgi:hypothetical protein